MSTVVFTPSTKDSEASQSSPSRTIVHMFKDGALEEIYQYLKDNYGNCQAFVNTSHTKIHPVFYLVTNDGEFEEELLEKLIFAGLNLNATNRLGQTLLHICCECKFQRLFEFLMVHGISTLQFDLQDHKGWTPLHEAVFNRNQCMTEALLDQGAKVDMQDNDGYTPLMVLCSGYCSQFHSPDVSLLRKEARMIDLLLMYGANPYLRTIRADNALSLAYAARKYKLVHYIAEKLTKRRAIRALRNEPLELDEISMKIEELAI
jgi:ankyrin repeat protein